MDPHKVVKSCSKGVFDDAQVFKGTTDSYNLKISVGSRKVIFALALNCSVDFTDFGISFFPQRNRGLVGDEGFEKLKKIMSPLGFNMKRKREGNSGPLQKSRYWKEISPSSENDVINAMNDALQKIGNARGKIESALNARYSF